MLRKLILAAALLGFGAGTALAQMPMGLSLGHNDKPQLTPEQRAKQKEIDDAYRAATAKIPPKKTTDPWGDIRPTPGSASR